MREVYVRNRDGSRTAADAPGRECVRGDCIYVNVLRNISLGLIILNAEEETVLYQNAAAAEVLRAITSRPDFRTIVSLLDLQGKDAGSTGTDAFHQRSLRHANNVYGYTFYRIPEGYICVFILDITEKVRLESIAESVNTMNSLGYIFSGIRHEIGNPVNSLKMTLSVLRNNVDSFSRDTILKYIDRALDEAGRIEYLLNSLKNFNMYESPHLTDVPLGEFLESFLSLAGPDVKNKGIRIETLFNPDAASIVTDPRALQQVLLNVLANAVDALKERPDPAITVSTFGETGRVKVRIVDNGAGMSEDQMAHLFKPFTTSKKDGTGLGLVICKKMLSRMNSTIEIKSRPDVGTIVEITVPGAVGAAGGASAEDDSPACRYGERADR